MDQFCQYSLYLKIYSKQRTSYGSIPSTSDAINNRDKMLTVLKGPKFEQIIKRLVENWVEFTPVKEEVVTAGIDSSFNNTKFQGIGAWATTAVSIKADGEILVDLHNSGLGL